MAEIDLDNLVSRIERLPLTRYIWFVIIAVGMATFFDGFGLYTSTVTAPTVEKVFSMGTTIGVLYVTGILLGNVIGDFIGGPLADAFGRRRFLWITTAIIGIGSIWTALSTNSPELIASRIFTGIGVGADLIVAYAYISEFIPSKSRGFITGAMYIILVAGIPVAITLGYFLIHDYPIYGWRYLYIIGGAAALVALLTRLGIPESPRFYFSVKKDASKANEALTVIEKHAEKNLGKKLPEPVHVNVPSEPARISYGKLFSANYRRATTLATLLSIFGLVGGLSVSFFMPRILIERGFTIQISLLYTAITAVGLIFGGIVPTVIRDAIERRHQLIIYAILAAVFGIMIGVAPTAAVIVISAFLFNLFNQAWAANYHMYIAEIFPATVRTTGPGFADAWGRLGTVVGSVFLFVLVTSLPLRLSLSAIIIILGAIAALTLGRNTSKKALENISGG